MTKFQLTFQCLVVDGFEHDSVAGRNVQLQRFERLHRLLAGCGHGHGGSDGAESGEQQPKLNKSTTEPSRDFAQEEVCYRKSAKKYSVKLKRTRNSQIIWSFAQRLGN